MSESRRVLHLLKGLGPGGAEQLVLAQATTPAPTPTSHHIAYLLPHKDHLVDALRAGGATTDCLESPSAARIGWIRRLRRVLREERFDVLHVHSPALAAVARLLVRTLPRGDRPALVGTEHNRWPRHHRLTRLANRATIRLEDATIAVSDDVAATISGTRSGQLRVVEHGIAVDAIRARADREGVRRELGFEPADVVVVCVANLRREKALDVLVQAAARALATEPSLRYLLVGQGPLADDVDRWISEAGVGDRFTALGYRDDAPRILSAGDVFTLSSAHEGLPVAMMEAMALGLPVAATAAGGVPDGAADAGRITPIGDATALADAHVALAREPGERARLGDAARRRADHFSVDRAVAEIDAIYTEASAGRS